ncbi:hypothetical protein [Natrinema halophilum]|uniref:Uncharacterized protein n=1 Tax=Natrinema halophilum TaxID=1699371 RepID=A0A7D5KCQ6_9EURY|nr:hypothetical protein [Natrinema halophilum]QLG48756.1 hypothetical protein HYG82_07805 [Natrinema halophilum]
MRIRTPDRDRANSASRTDLTANPPSVDRYVRYLLIAGVVLAFTYAVRRLFGSNDGGIRSVDEFQERAADAVPDELTEPTATIPIGEPGDDEPETDDEVPAETNEAPAGADDADAIDETATNAEYAADRSDEEIAERAEPDVRTEPAEPGEMTVDESVAEDLLDADTDPDSAADGDRKSEDAEETEE